MTKTEFRRTLKELARRRSLTAAAFDRKGDEERKARVESCRDDIFEFARIYLPHYYHDKRASFHDDWKRLIEVEGKVVVIAAPRGHGKSAFFTLFSLLKALLYEERKFIIISSDTEAQAKGLLGFIAEELKENERIKEDFAQVLKTASFSASDIIVGAGKIVAKGKGQSLRGLRHGPYRPDTFVGDDLEMMRNRETLRG